MPSPIKRITFFADAVSPANSSAIPKGIKQVMMTRDNRSPAENDFVFILLPQMMVIRRL
jgi:hypothetical protein